MSTSKESNSCPDGYRALSTSELRELLQNDDKMDQIIRLNEKVRSVPTKCREEFNAALNLLSCLHRCGVVVPRGCGFCLKMSVFGVFFMFGV